MLLHNCTWECVNAMAAHFIMILRSLTPEKIRTLVTCLFWKYPFQLQFKAIVGVRCVNFIIHQKKYTRFLYFHLPKSLLNRYPSLISYISGLCSCYTKYGIQFAHYSGIIKASKTLSIPLICFDRLLLSLIFHEKELLIYFVIEGSILFFVTITLLLLLPVFV